MADWFLLTLDTTHPTVTWGAYGGANAGELFQINYALDELGSVREAWLVDAGGVRVELEDIGGTLRGLLPDDVFSGYARVYVRVRDDLLNEGERYTTVLLVSPYAPPQADRPSAGPPMGARPQPRRAEHRTVVTRSVAGASSSDTVTVSTSHTARAGATSRTTVASRPGARGRYVGLPSPRAYGPAVAVASSRDRLATTVAGSPSAAGGTSTSTVTRHDGDEELAAMLLLL